LTSNNLITSSNPPKAAKPYEEVTQFIEDEEAYKCSSFVRDP
jgi:hypothetical protein